MYFYQNFGNQGSFLYEMFYFRSPLGRHLEDIFLLCLSDEVLRVESGVHLGVLSEATTPVSIKKENKQINSILINFTGFW